MPCESCGLNIVNLAQTGSIPNKLFYDIISNHNNFEVCKTISDIEPKEYLNLHKSTLYIPKFLYQSFHPLKLPERGVI
jgi:hypothetical protein